MKIIHKSIIYLASPLLTIVLLAVFTVYIAVGTRDNLNLYNSYPFLIFLLILFLNTLTCTWRQITRQIKNPGSIIFHLGLVLVIVGGFVSYAFGFEGKFGLTEGGIFNGVFNGYTVKGPLGSDYNSDIKLFLNKISPKYLKDQTFSRSLVMITRNGLEDDEMWVSKGNPYKAGFYTITNDMAGYYIYLKCIIDGKEEGINIGLETQKHTDKETYSSKLERIRDYYIKLYFYPNYSSYKKHPFQPDLKPVDTVLSLMLYDKNKKILTRQMVKPGSVINFNKSVLIRFENFYPWASFILKRDYGLPVIYGGFILCITGLFMIYFRFPFRYYIKKTER